MVKSPDAFRSIGEVARMVGVAPHVLRYWEGQFTQLTPVKRADGRRYYRPDDIRLIAGLCQVLREEGLSIRGAKMLIAADRGAGLRDIGAARLGEDLPFADGSPALRAGPAVRLVPPSPIAASSATAAATTSQNVAPQPEINTAPETAPLARTAPSPVMWLERLVAASSQLRQMHASGRLTTQMAAALRELR